MVDVRATKESMVQRLRLGEGKSTDEDIQKKLDQVFQHGQLESSSEQNRGQANSLHSFNSFRSSIFATRSSIQLDSDLKREIKTGLNNSTRWAEILEQIQSAQGLRQQQGIREDKLTRQLLEVRDCTGKDRKWRLVILDVLSIKQKIMQEVHLVPYAGYLGYQKTLEKLQQHFY